MQGPSAPATSSSNNSRPQRPCGPLPLHSSTRCPCGSQRGCRRKQAPVMHRKHAAAAAAAAAACGGLRPPAAQRQAGAEGPCRRVHNSRQQPGANRQRHLPPQAGCSPCRRAAAKGAQGICLPPVPATVAPLKPGRPVGSHGCPPLSLVPAAVPAAAAATTAAGSNPYHTRRRPYCSRPAPREDERPRRQLGHQRAHSRNDN